MDAQRERYFRDTTAALELWQWSRRHGDAFGQALACARLGPLGGGWRRILELAPRLSSAELELLDHELTDWPAPSRITPLPWFFNTTPTLRITRHLAFFRHDFTTDFARLLHDPQRLHHITSLSLRACWLSPDDIHTLTQSPHLAHLTHLDLTDNFIQDAGAHHLAQSPHLTHLTHLKLEGCGLSIEGARTLTTSEHLRALTSLHLSRNLLGDPAPRLLLTTSPTTLALDEIGLTDAGLSNLPIALPHRNHLALSGNDIGPDGLRALARAGYMSQLQAVDLSRNPLGDAGAEIIARTASSTLRGLFLSDSGITPLGADLLASSQNLRHLTALDLAGNPLSDTGLAAIAHPACPWRALRALSLVGVGAGPEGVYALTRSRDLPALVELRLGMNPIGPRGAAHLSHRRSRLHALEHLTLDACRLRDDGAQALARAEHLKQLTTLKVAFNEILDHGALALIQSPRLQALSHLDLSQNRISPEGCQALQQCPLEVSGLNEQL